MRRVDKEILDLLDRTKLVLNPVSIARNINYNQDYITTRLGILVDHDLVIKEERGWYRISPQGEKFIRGEMLIDEIKDELYESEDLDVDVPNGDGDNDTE